MPNREEIQQALLKQIANKELERFRFHNGSTFKLDTYLFIDHEKAFLTDGKDMVSGSVCIHVNLNTFTATKLFSKTYTMDLIMDAIQGHFKGSHHFDQKAATAIEKLVVILK